MRKDFKAVVLNPNCTWESPRIFKKYSCVLHLQRYCLNWHGLQEGHQDFLNLMRCLIMRQLIFDVEHLQMDKILTGRDRSENQKTFAKEQMQERGKMKSLRQGHVLQFLIDQTMQNQEEDPIRPKIPSFMS